MQEPALEPQTPKAQNLNDASAAAADAGIENVAADSAAPQPEAEAEAESIMTQGEEDFEAKDVNREITAESLLADALALMEKDAADISNDEIRRLRQHFSMLHKSVDSAAEAAEAPAAPSETETRFEQTIEALRARKAQYIAEQEALRAANLERKNAIIEQINALAEDTDNVNRTFPRYRELQDEFNAVGDVDPTEETAVWKRFQEAREHYSDNLKINKELRDYDFKKSRRCRNGWTCLRRGFR